MDCNMPIKNGYDTCKYLKSMIAVGALEDIKIVAVTADVTKLNRQKCEEAGFDEFLEKPIKHLELDRILSDTFSGDR